MSIIVKCKADKEIYRNEDFRIIAFSPLQTYAELKISKYFTFSVKGSNMPYITINKEYTIEIEELSSDKFGTAYSLLSCPSLDAIDLKNLTRDEAKEILLDCTSSEKIANNILNAYPNFIELIMVEGKQAIDTSKIKGVGSAYLEAYSRELLSKYKYYHILKKYNMYKIDINDCKALVDLYKDDNGIGVAFTDNPYYVLTEALGRGFEQSDKLILENRPELENSEQRCEALIISVLRRNEYEGSTRLSGVDLYNYIKNEYNVPYLIPMLKDVSVKSDYIYYDEVSKDLSVMQTYLAECKIASFVKSKLANSTKLDIDWKKYRSVNGFDMTDMQLECLHNFCDYNISILAGVSGSGKTSGVENLVKLMEDNNMSYCLLAPTGSASLRLATQTKRKASTIHRRVLRDGEICSDVILVDENSMLGLDVFTMLIDAISNDDCRIVLCGDPSQIPSISCSSIFADMIKSNIVPMTMLTQVFRYNTNGGSFVGENIRKGEKFLDEDVVKEKDGIYTIYNNYKFIECDEDYIFDNVIKEYGKLAKKYKLDDIIILSAFNLGECGTRALNRAIEDEYNPPRPNEKIMSYKIKDEDVIFRVGSRVVNIKNNYKSLTLEAWELIENSNGVLTADDVSDLFTELFNGEIGVVRSIDDKKMVCQFNEQLIVFTKSNIFNLLLARAISIHRSQGGEWQAVINIISTKHKKMLSRNLLYVSDTRGKKYHCDIGSRVTLENTLLIDSVAERSTWLEELLING